MYINKYDKSDTIANQLAEKEWEGYTKWNIDVKAPPSNYLDNFPEDPEIEFLNILGREICNFVILTIHF